MSSSIEPATLEDLDALVEIYYGISSSDGQVPRIDGDNGDDDGTPDPFGNTPDGRIFVHDAYESFIRSSPGRQESHVFISRDEHGHAVASVLAWVIKASDGGLWRWDQRWPPPRPTMDAAKLEEFFEADMAVQHKAVMQTREHIYLELIVTLPNHRKKGHGSALLKRVNALADERDFDLYLDAVKDAARLYEVVGYEPQDKERRSPILMPMLRPRKSHR